MSEQNALVDYSSEENNVNNTDIANTSVDSGEKQDVLPEALSVKLNNSDGVIIETSGALTVEDKDVTVDINVIPIECSHPQENTIEAKEEKVNMEPKLEKPLEFPALKRKREEVQTIQIREETPKEQCIEESEEKKTFCTLL